jgi:hypothetical protein
MDWRYSKFDPSLRDMKERLKRLLAIFNQLLLHVDGDVEQALDYLDQVGRRYGLLDAKLTIEDFKKFLEKENAIARDRRGRMALTKKGEQQIRTSSLEAVHSNAMLEASIASPRLESGSSVYPKRARTHSAIRSRCSIRTRRSRTRSSAAASSRFRSMKKTCACTRRNTCRRARRCS